jgi:hypothetical protein
MMLREAEAKNTISPFRKIANKNMFSMLKL